MQNPLGDSDTDKVPENVKNAIVAGYKAGRLPLVILRLNWKSSPALLNVNGLDEIRFMFLNNDDYNPFLCFVECNLETNTCGPPQYKRLEFTFE